MRRSGAAVLALAATGLAVSCGGVPAPAGTHDAHHDGHHAGHEAGAAAGLPRRAGEVRGPAAGSSAFPTVTFAGDGRLWAAWVEGGQVWASSSAGRGASWAPAVAVSPADEEIDANGEARPKIAVGPGGEAYVSYTRKGTRPYTGEVRFARSLDGGAGFSAPLTVNAPPDDSGHRFDTLAVGPDGTITMVWIDKRDRDIETAAGRPYVGAALYAAVSTDRGATFSTNRALLDHACECCRIAAAGLGDGRVALLWRHVFGAKTRDHALVVLAPDGAPGPLRRATFDGWELDGCPHHGPSLAAGPDGTLHLAWFTGAGAGGKGIFYGRSADGGETVSSPTRLAASASAGHPAVLATASGVWVAWLEPAAAGSTVRAIRSRDGGRSFGPPVELATSAGAGDHPFLLADRGRAVLAWFTEREGLVLLDLEGSGRG
ncbi:MAG: exo-alpha-sialidase [Acidobacteria bacterium]|nr:exo-alpha-sialidase [Acidobacteriota bacterium]